MDAQLPPALATLLKGDGYEADHVASVGLRDADVTAIWDFALQHDAIIVTKDEDFPHRQKQAKISPLIVWLCARNTSRRASLEWERVTSMAVYLPAVGSVQPGPLTAHGPVRRGTWALRMPSPPRPRRRPPALARQGARRRSSWTPLIFFRRWRWAAWSTP
jgi:predicted nuclease of predicted toxin-antitoxin system